MMLLFLFLGLPAFLLSVDFIRYLVTGKKLYNSKSYKILEVVIIIGLPVFYLTVYDTSTNDCCTDSATFSPDHKLTVLVVIFICVLAYFCSVYKKKIVSPVIETLLNAILLGGIVFNCFLAFHVESLLWPLGNLPIIILFLFELIKNQEKLAAYTATFEVESLNALEKFAWKILNSKLIFKIPVLLFLCLPILTVISGFLMLFGQKPDAIIRGFTDTYKHGFSQLDYMCDNVQCGGHFLCSVAANGHKNIVSPKRLGERGGNKIMCNRQLLVSNAFEELLQDKLPKTHTIIRKNYNKIGGLIHRYYGVFNLKIIADTVYVLMKPLEWFFLVILYTFDQNPENRIAQQYLAPLDRKEIKNRTRKL